MWEIHHFINNAIPPFAKLEKLFGLSKFKSWPNAQGLNEVTKKLSVDVPEFVCQEQLTEQTAGEAEYYEQIIFNQGHIPTRPDNWHDLFNALIWMMFPKTKYLLNQMHMQDIDAFGLSPRTQRRNKITHFDECGVVLLSSDTTLPELLAEHNWVEAFWEKRNNWFEHNQVLVFGHANLEMLLDPFEGLTGKWLHLKVEPDYFSLPLEKQLTIADQKLCEVIKKGAFEQQRPLKPIPLLGIPGWCEENKRLEYYHNTDYFRPKRGLKK